MPIKGQGRLLRTRLGLRALLQGMTPEELRSGLRSLQLMGYIVAYKCKNRQVNVYYWAGTADMDTIMRELASPGNF